MGDSSRGLLLFKCCQFGAISEDRAAVSDITGRLTGIGAAVVMATSRAMTTVDDLTILLVLLLAGLGQLRHRCEVAIRLTVFDIAVLSKTERMCATAQ